MYIMQLVHLKNLDEKKDILGKTSVLNENDKNFSERNIEDIPQEINLNNQTKSQLKNTNQIKANPVKNIDTDKKTKIEISSFQDLIDKTNKEKEIELKYDLERNVKLVNFNKGKIDISFNEKLNKNFIKNLTEKLLQWTVKDGL